jgi:hypothetical protein
MGALTRTGTVSVSGRTFLAAGNGTQRIRQQCLSPPFTARFIMAAHIRRLEANDVKLAQFVIGKANMEGLTVANTRGSRLLFHLRHWRRLIKKFQRTCTPSCSQYGWRCPLCLYSIWAGGQMLAQMACWGTCLRSQHLSPCWRQSSQSLTGIVLSTFRPK